MEKALLICTKIACYYSSPLVCSFCSLSDVTHLLMGHRPDLKTCSCPRYMIICLMNTCDFHKIASITLYRNTELQRPLLWCGFSVVIDGGHKDMIWTPFANTTGASRADTISIGLELTSWVLQVCYQRFHQEGIMHLTIEMRQTQSHVFYLRILTIVWLLLLLRCYFCRSLSKSSSVCTPPPLLLCQKVCKGDTVYC